MTTYRINEIRERIRLVADKCKNLCLLRFQRVLQKRKSRSRVGSQGFME